MWFTWVILNISDYSEINVQISLNQGPGKSFGEVALVKRESFRNASIIADEDLDLLVIGQDLFDRSLKVLLQK